MLANTLEALVGRNDTFLSSPLPLTATLNELASVVQRAGQLLRMKQGMDGDLDTVDDIMHAGKRYIEYYKAKKESEKRAYMERALCRFSISITPTFIKSVSWFLSCIFFLFKTSRFFFNVYKYFLISFLSCRWIAKTYKTS